MWLKTTFCWHVIFEFDDIKQCSATGGNILYSRPVCISTRLFEIDLVPLLLDLHVSVLDKRPRTLLQRIAFHSRGLRSRVHQLLVCESLHLLPLEAIIVTGFATLWNL